MEQDERNIPRITKATPPVEAEFMLQWGSRKRLRCVRVRGSNRPGELSSSSRIRRRFLTHSHNEAPCPEHRNLEMTTEIRKSLSPEKEERYYKPRSSMEDNENQETYDKRKIVWPKLCISLSSKEKEEDFMAMKGCKLPQRPKKRGKLIQRTLLLASPGAWLSDMSLERYQVREKKTCKKKARGLKAMGLGEIDSESEGS